MSGTDYTLTPKLGLYKPITDADVDQWGTHWNLNADQLDRSVLYDASNSVGINLTPPSPSLGGSLFAARFITPADGLYFNGYTTDGSNWLHLNAGPSAWIGRIATGEILLQAAASGAAGSQVTGAQNWYFSAKGNMGVGVLPPAAQAVADPAANGGWLFGWGLTANNWATNGYYDGVSWRYLAAGEMWQTQPSGTAALWQYAPAGAKDAVATPATKMWLDGTTGDLHLTGQAFIPVAANISNGAYPTLNMISSAAPANQHNWGMALDPSGNFFMQFISDDGLSGSAFLGANRSSWGTTWVNITAPTINLYGNTYTSGNLNVAGSISVNSAVSGTSYSLFTHQGNPYIRFRSDGWDLVWDNSSGNLSFYAAGDLLWRAQGDGTTWQKYVTSVASGVVYRSYNASSSVGWHWDGSYIYLYVDGTYVSGMASHAWTSANFKNIGTYTPNQNVDYNQSPTFTDVHVSSRTYTNDIMNVTGNFYVANNYAYYLQRDGSGNWNFVEGGTNNLQVGADGWSRGRTGFIGGGIFSYGNVYWGNDWSHVLGNGGVGQILQFAPGYYFEYNNSNGTVQYILASVARWTQRYDGPMYNAQSWTGGIGPHVDVSDERGKQDIRPDSTGLAAILGLDPIRFRRRQDPRVELLHIDADREELGFSADAVRRVIPSAVLRAGIRLPDGSGEIDSDEPSLGLMTTPIVAALVNAVKELTYRITELEARA